MADGNITVVVNAHADEVERLRQNFQRETLRASQLAGRLRRFVELHEAEHAPGPWARGYAAGKRRSRIEIALIAVVSAAVYMWLRS